MTRLLHLSDNHVSATGIDEDGVDAVASLHRILHDVRHVPDVVDVGSNGTVTSLVLTARDPHANNEVYVYAPITGENVLEPD